MENKVNPFHKMLQDKKDIHEAIQNGVPLSELKHIKFVNPMENNLDSSWKYTTKVNIHIAELNLRNTYYRQGINDFKAKLIKALEEDIENEVAVEVIKNLKNE